MSAMTISPDHIARFHQDGFLILRSNEHNLVDPSALQSWALEVRSWPAEKGKWMPYSEVTSNGQRQLMRTENFVDYHPRFTELLCGERLPHILKQLSGDDMLLFKDKINYKLAGGNGFAAHLDAPAYDHIGEIEHLTANLAVDAATKENGYLEVVPGSHRMDVELSHGGKISEAWEKSHEWVTVPLEPGDMLLFGSHLAHRSGPNRTDESRSAVYATYHSRADGLDLRKRYYADRRANFPPDHERDPNKDYSQGWKRYGFAAPFSKETPVAKVSEVKVA